LEIGLLRRTGGELFRARVITFLADKGLWPVARAQTGGQRDKRVAEDAKAVGPGRADHRRVRTQTAPDPIGEVARTHQSAFAKATVRGPSGGYGLCFVARAPPEIAGRVIEISCDDPFPDEDTEPACRELAEPVMAYANG